MSTNPDGPKIGDPMPWIGYDTKVEPPAQDIAREISGSEPSMLFHYSGAAALQGILRSKRIWATELKYLNDSEEFVLAIRRAFSYLERLLPSVKNQTLRAGFEVTIGQFRYPENYNIFVSSFSQERDSLSQWRAYCNDGGYAIGFRTNTLTPKNSEILLARCLYDDEQQQKLIERLVARYVHVFIPYVESFPQQRETAVCVIHKQLTEELLLLAPMIKHASFSSEREWRLIIPNAGETGRVRHRSKNGLLIPYVEYPLDPSESGLQPTEIVLSPTLAHELGELSVRSCLQANGIESCAIGSSSSPYRTL